MIERISELIDVIPDTVKMILIISFISIFWDVILGL